MVGDYCNYHCTVLAVEFVVDLIDSNCRNDYFDYQSYRPNMRDD